MPASVHGNVVAGVACLVFGKSGVSAASAHGKG